MATRLVSNLFPRQTKFFSRGQCRFDRISRSFSFSFAGPRKLEEIVKLDLLEGKTAEEVTEIWKSYHDTKENVHGFVVEGKEGKSILSRAAQCPFFIQPIFREDGFFMLVSQFQKPNHFLMAYLEDYKMDPSAANPLLTFSVFDDLSEKLDISLVRCDIINKGIQEEEGAKVTEHLVDLYRNDDEFTAVHAFNKAPHTFDYDDHISRQNQKWNQS
mmetsp:Transcript_26650/g.37555  ORF Transcript_26650/g.37555 Transcript_26650/m.37555 type:complete len:215 (+) Transcript_26650:114-758(+)